jgi:hypothetical protein
MRGDRILHWLMKDILVPLDDLTMFAEKGVLLIRDVLRMLCLFWEGRVQIPLF